jgi:hypothetical protein
MNYFIDKLTNEISALRSVKNSLDSLSAIANIYGEVENWKYPELFEWTNYNTLFDKSYVDDVLPVLEWHSCGDYSMYHTFTNGSDYYNLQLTVGQGSDVDFYKVKPEDLTNEIKQHASRFDAVKKLADTKADFLQTKLDSLKAKEDVKMEAKTDLKTKLDTVRLIKNIMDDLGLSFDEDSKKKIIEWESEYKEK